MNINYKYFLTGMILALGPVFIWAEHKLDTNIKVLGANTLTTAELDTDVRDYNYFASSKVASSDSMNENSSEVLEPTIEPTSTPMPTATQKPVAQVAAQERTKPTPTPVEQNAPGDYDALIDKYAIKYGADPNLMKKIAKCESGYNPNAISPSGAYHGMYQFVAGTWISNREAMGLDPNLDLRRNAEEAIKTAAFKMGRDGYGAWPVCSKI